MRQISFQFFRDYKKTFGGTLLEGKRKTQRPLSTKTPIHLILKANQKKIFGPDNQRLHRLIQEMAEKFSIRVYDLAINWSHIHFLIQIKNRKDYVRFIRALTLKLAMGVKKIDPTSGKLFNLRPFTRIVTWGRDFKNTFKYLTKNLREAYGWIPPKNTKTSTTARGNSKCFKSKAIIPRSSSSRNSGNSPRRKTRAHAHACQSAKPKAS